MANFVLFMLEIALFTRLTLQSSFWLRMAFVHWIQFPFVIFVE